MAGVEEKIIPPEPVEENVYKMGAAEREKRGIRQLPGSLLEAVQLTGKEQSSCGRRWGTTCLIILLKTKSRMG